LDYNGATYTLTRVRDNQVTNLTATATATGYTLSSGLGQAALPGIEITIDLSGGKTRSAGDQFLIRPTYDAAQKIGLNINDPEKIAAATNIELDPVTRLPVSPVSIIKGPMPGDNSNALKLAALENKLTMTGGHATLKDTYGQIVSSVGTLTQAAEVGSSAQQTLLNQAKGARESLVGVNLDEEAANLIKFQQAYQASAQSISVARSLFDTLIGAVR
jgi:flagellar hook-associated protein 1 FlgK